MSSARESESGGTPRAALLNSLKRKYSVYVDIPPSPLHSASRQSAQSSSRTGSPLSSKAVIHNRGPILQEASLKKLKVSDTVSTEQRLPSDQSMNSSGQGDPQFPNGFFYCHQCNKKKDAELALRCTVVHQKKRCRSKYCKSCLKRKYQEDADSIKLHNALASPVSRTGHEVGEGYIWKCPRCRDSCICFKCLKAKGLPPMSHQIKMQKEREKEKEQENANLTELPEPSKKPTSSKSKLGQPSTRLENGAHPSSITRTSSKAPAAPRPRAPRKPRAVPMPAWHEVPTELELSEVEERFALREFFVRFAPLMKIGAKHLEDLDEFDLLTEPCVKTLFLNILDIVGAEATEEVHKHVRASIKAISSSGFDLNKFWTHLAPLRDFIKSDLITIPEPRAAQPADEDAIQTRRRREGSIMHASQLIPTLLGFVELAIQGASIRNEIEVGSRDLKQATQEHWAKCRTENERWEEEKQSMQDNKAKQCELPGWDEEEWMKLYKSRSQTHKSTMDGLEHLHRLDTWKYTPRSGPLGRDTSGRIYYVSAPYNSKKIPSEETRASLTKWSWFVAVWGPGGDTSNSTDGSEEERKWWGFSDPGEIKKLAKWISRNTSGTDDTPDVSPQSDDESSDQPADKAGFGPPSEKDIKDLSKALIEFADFLEWRCAA